MSAHRPHAAGHGQAGGDADDALLPGLRGPRQAVRERRQVPDSTCPGWQEDMQVLLRICGEWEEGEGLGLLRQEVQRGRQDDGAGGGELQLHLRHERQEGEGRHQGS